MQLLVRHEAAGRPAPIEDSRMPSSTRDSDNRASPSVALVWAALMRSPLLWYQPMAGIRNSSDSGPFAGSAGRSRCADPQVGLLILIERDSQCLFDVGHCLIVRMQPVSALGSCLEGHPCLRRNRLAFGAFGAER